MPARVGRNARHHGRRKKGQKKRKRMSAKAKAK